MNSVGYVSFVKDIIFYAMMMFFLFLLFKFLKYLSRESPLSIKALKCHHWKSLQSLHENLNHASYCSYCESLIMDGFYCDSCGLRTERQCIKKVNSKYKCKEISAPLGGPMRHHWVKGNLPVGRNCFVCDEECATDSGLVDYLCVWCSRVVHSKCKSTLGEVCDFGKTKPMIVPPNCVKLGSAKQRMKSSISILESITSPMWKEWSPLFILGNSKSGNSAAGEILSTIRGVLNPCQVFDISTSGTEGLLRVLKMLPDDAKPRIMVAGGDGTVAWLLSDMVDLLHNLRVPVGIIPLGTGNDLSRVLGWGAHEPNDVSPSSIFDMVRQAEEIDLDRWKVCIMGSRRQLGRRTPACKQLYMYNYLSVGVDALVTLKFHNTRQSPFYIFTSRIVNKLMYLAFGTEQVLERYCKDLENKIEVYLDGVKAELPSMESIVILNIPFWGAGVPLWNIGSGEGKCEQHIDDGKLEVAAVYSSFHIAQLQVGLSEPHRIGQARHIRIKVKSRLPMQVDGEPWMQSPGDINIGFHNRAAVLKLPSQN